MRSKKLFLWVAVPLFCAVTSIALYSQTQQGDIIGTIRDPQANVIPGVAVKIVNEDTGAIRELVTDSNGDYSGLGFFVGTYRVEVEKTGFQKALVPGIKIDPQTRRRVDLTLQIGTVETEVTVSGSVPVVKTEGATINADLPRVMNEKPMNNSSRAGWAFDPLMWVPGSAGGPNALMLWGGVTGSQVEVQVEGNQMYIEAELGQQSIEQLSVVMGTPPAEYGRSSAMNVTLRSGSNALHGSLVENLKNPAVDAVNTISTANQRPPGFPQWRTEFNLGGPVVIPKVYNGRNKTFFFFDYWRSAYGSALAPRVVSIPSPSLQRGDFSKYVDGNGNVIPIRDPLTGQVFSGNVIPTNRLSQSSQAINKDIYGDNFGNPFQYVGNPDTNLNNASALSGSTGIQQAWVVKIDQNIGTKHVLSGSYNGLWAPTYYSQLCGACYTGARQLRLGVWASDTWPQTRVSVGYTYTPTPHLVNQLRVGVTRYDCHGGPVNSYSDRTPISGTTMLARWGIQGISDPSINAMPGINIDTWENMSANTGFGFVDTRYQVYENLTYIRGSHNIKAGVDFVKADDDRIYNAGVGNFNFDGRFTGEPFADFLLGLPGTYSRSRGRPTQARRINEYAAYIQDDWRITPKLTLSYGLRWDRYGAPYDKNGLYYNFDPASGKIVVPDQYALDHIDPLWPKNTIPVVLASTLGYPEKLIKPNTRWLPRLGYAYRPTNSSGFVVRGGFGFYNAVFRFGGLQTTGPFTLSEAFDNSLSAMKSFPNPFPATAGTATGVATGASVSKDFRPDYLMAWNTSVEKEFLPDWGFRVSYMGNKSTQLAASYNMNTPLLSTQPFSQSRRPYPNFQNITRIENGANSRYNALQMLVHHPFRNGLLLEASYMLQRATDDTGGGGEGLQWARDTAPSAALDYAYNRTRDRGPSAQWPHHDILVNYNYDLPFGRGKHWLADTSGNPGKWVLARVVGNWSTNGYFNWHSGHLFTPTYSGYDPGNINQFSGRPNVVPGCQLYTGLPFSSATAYFNTNCFTAPAPGTLGNAPINMLEGPGMWILTLNPYKEFHIPHWERGTLRVGAWIYNILNSGAYWSRANGNIGSFNTGPDGKVALTPNPSGTYLFPWFVRRGSEGAFQRQFTFTISFQF